MLAVLLALVCLLWIGSVIDGYRTAKKTRLAGGELNVKGYGYALFAGVHFLLMAGIQIMDYQHASLVNLFKIPTPAMAPALDTGDHVAVLQTKKIERHDIVVFQYPMDPATYYIKRCMGMPGDSLEVKDAEVYINGSLTSCGVPLQYRYFVYTGTTLNERVFEKYQIKGYEIISGGYLIYATERATDRLGELHFIDSVSAIKGRPGEADPRIFPDAGGFSWNQDFYGPLLVPANGVQIQINETTLAAYGRLIRQYEGHDQVEIRNDELAINGRIMKQYTFNGDYYFVMGDNRHNSLDSRYWGFVPQKMIYGKTLYRYWAKDRERIGRI